MIDRTAEDVRQDQKIANLEEAVDALKGGVALTAKLDLHQRMNRIEEGIRLLNERVVKIEAAIGPLEKLEGWVEKL
jgi:predicted GTPase